jgi:F-type H+/Na+-transporting ATPase subunit alpha
LKQGLNAPMPVEEQVVVIYAGTRGWLDTVPVEDVVRFGAEFLTDMRAKHTDILSNIKETSALNDTEALDAALKSFLDSFAPSN